MSKLTLENDTSRLEMKPNLGGGVGSLWHRGSALLSPTPSGARKLEYAACLPLVPTSYRPYYEWTEDTLGAAPVPTNSEGRASGWIAGKSFQSDLLLKYRVFFSDDGGQNLEQRIRFIENGCQFKLSVRNDGPEPMTGGMGYRCRVPFKEGSTITLSDLSSDKEYALSYEDVSDQTVDGEWNTGVVTHSTGARTVLRSDIPVRFTFRREDDVVVATLLAEIEFARFNHKSGDGSDRTLTFTLTDR